MRSTSRLTSIATAMALAGVLSACATDPYASNNGTYPTPHPGPTYSSSPTYPSTAYPQGAPAALEYGRVTAIEQIATQGRSGPNVGGAVIGAVAGALIGNQIGRVTGSREAGTVLGAVGGGVVGSRAGGEQQATASNPPYRITIQTEQGAMRSYDVGATGDLRVGDRVRVENGVIYRS